MRLSLRLFSHFGDIVKDVFLLSIIGNYLRNSSTLFLIWVDTVLNSHSKIDFTDFFTFIDLEVTDWMLLLSLYFGFN